MQVKKIIKLIDAIDNKSYDDVGFQRTLPSDMYELGTETYRQSDGACVSIRDMDFVHLVRAFKKTINYDEGLQHSVSDANQIFKLEKKVSELLYKNEELKNNHHSVYKKDYVKKEVYTHLEERNVFLQEKIEDLYRRLEAKAFKTVGKSPRYMFSEIPNNDKGRRMIEEMKDTLNNDRYTMRVRGQHVKEEYKGTGVTAYGQNIEQSTHLRVYIEEK